MNGTSNGYHGGDDSVLVLYKIVNSPSDKSGLFNAFRMPRGNAVTLKSIKQHCAALHHLNTAGPDGYHWRVCMEDNRTQPPKSGPIPFSWWDIQDENARLPVKESTPQELEHMFFPKHSSSPTSSTDSASKAAKGAFKTLGKAMNAVVDTASGSSGVDHHGPPVGVIAFKLLDLLQLHDTFDKKHGGPSRGGFTTPTSATMSKPARTTPATAAPAARAAPVGRTPARAAAQPRPAPAAPQPAARRAPAPTPVQPLRRPAPAPAPAAAATANLMDFGDGAPASNSAPPPAAHALHRMNTSPANMNPNETRAQKLKREYEQNKHKQNRVWDEIDQRWVAVDPKQSTKAGSTSAPPGEVKPAAIPKAATATKAKGISIDASNAVGKSANVQAAVNQRVNEMKESQAKALQEVRERENKKKTEEAEEDEVRKRLEPKIIAWSEEHGKKKQLRALLASLHTILWPDAKWKTVTIGDLLNDKKVKLAFHKASRVVHPDKTHHLDAEKRFLAKRIFDALSQAKTDFDNGAN
eukprot:CAMPEP_0195292750 /NCGR_PEP_ID=MMETSP0707-20130614/10802_1 /TAXON_ID=33640 /ORGANISM="Asterionellopsis glacialis, Strain CCMP134" /LENGTH=523 /DNA_ID=CAMNT_0040353311 /DNA_START=64 /DNA_END=1635 /DNA_ORIENTATION=-